MGVEYRHTIAVGDLDWVPDAGARARVLAALEKWGLAQTGASPFQESRDDSEEVISLGEPDGARIRAVLGPASDRRSDGSGHEVYLVLGADWKITEDDGGLDEPFACFACEREVEPEEWDVPFGGMRVPARCEECESRNLPPRDVVDRQTPGARFGGGVLVWRSGIVIECGKDLPAFSLEGAGIPNADFRRDLEAAFGKPLIERGTAH